MRAVLTPWLAGFRRDERGATAIEYGLIAALMAVAIIASLFALGNSTNGMFTIVSNRVTAAHQSGN
jgi:pilus assembly protein Flp/PilA